MNERAFKKHLADLAHGHHHPEEHDWGKDPSVAGAGRAVKPAKAKKRATKRTAKKK